MRCYHKQTLKVTSLASGVGPEPLHVCKCCPITFFTMRSFVLLRDTGGLLLIASQVESRRPVWSAKCHWYVHLIWSHSVRNAAHLVWFIMEISCTPYVLGLALAVVLCS